MSVSLITLHAYATWMPDRREGSFHYRRGYQAQSDGLDYAYRAKQREPSASFDDAAQQLFLDEIVQLAKPLRLEPHAAASDRSHLHIFVAWPDERTPIQVRGRLKHWLTLRLNTDVARRTWFTRGGHCAPVKNDNHFNYLRDVYLPRHAGWKWKRGVGFWRDAECEAVPRVPECGDDSDE